VQRSIRLSQPGKRPIETLSGWCEDIRRKP
jgi:hypothetical protein